jgi:hypothetical protein
LRTLAVLAAAIGAVSALSARGAAGAPATTKPGVLYIAKTIVTDTAIKIPKDQFRRGTQVRYPRGALIRYDVTNRGTRAYALEIWGSKTTVMRPARRASLLINWNYRGTYVYQLLYKGKPAGPRGTVIIF